MPVLRGRTAIDVFAAFMESFRDEFDGWMGNTITECLIGKACQGVAPSSQKPRTGGCLGSMISLQAVWSQLLLVCSCTLTLPGLGPNTELKYPGHPSDKRWNFPGIGEFQVSGSLSNVSFLHPSSHIADEILSSPSPSYTSSFGSAMTGSCWLLSRPVPTK